MPGFPFSSGDEQPHLHHGEGVSRAAPDPRNKPFKVKVALRGSPSMLFTQDALSIDDAMRFAQNRWPDALITPITSAPNSPK